MRAMKPLRDDPSAPPRRPPKWVSPWSFDAEWQDEEEHVEIRQAQPHREADPSTTPVKARPVAPAEINSRARSDTPAATSAAKSPPVSLPEDSLPYEEEESSKPDEPADEPVIVPAPEPESKVGFETETPPGKPPFTQPARRQAQPPRAEATGRFSTVLSRLLTVLMGLSGILLFGWIYLADVTPEPDPDLRLDQPVDITPAIGAPGRLTTFLNAVISVEREDLRDKSPWKWDTQILRQVVQANGAAIDGLRDLLTDYDWHPGHSAWNQEDLGDHAAWPHVITLLEAKAALLAQTDESAALATVIDMTRLARHLHELRSWPSFMHRSQEFHQASLQTAATLLRTTRLDSGQLGEFQRGFAGLEPGNESLHSALGAFYLHEKKRLLGEKSGEPLDTMPGGVLKAMPARLFFKTRETLGLFASGFRELRADVTRVSSQTSASQSRLRLIGHAPLQGLSPNGAGESYFAGRWRLYHDLPERHHLAQAGHRLIVTLCAVRRFAVDHQRPPSGLAELRAAYLAEELTDPFSGRPLEYDPLNDVLFSAGANLLPEGGHITQPPLSDPDEPSLELGLKTSATSPAR